MAAFFSFITILLALQLAFLLWNRLYYRELGGERELSNSKYDKVMPGHISILIPARNEERNIEACLQSLVELADQPLEIIVLDDHSEDRTAAYVRSFAERSGSVVRLLQGKPLPEGWMGKSHACAQLSSASGRWLLFMDADVRLGPQALAAARGATRQGAGLISGFPRQETGTWMEKLVVSMMMFTILCHLPLRLISRSRDPKFAAANGAFILVEQGSYLAIGGHAAVRESLLDDMELIRLAKGCGQPVQLAKIDRLVRMRMYRNAGEVWSGYRKNLFPGLGRNLPLMAAVFVIYALLYLLPAAALLWGLGAAAAGGALPHWTLWATLGFLLGVLIKLTADRTSGLPVWYSLFMPLSIGLTILIGLDSARIHYAGSGYEWKGRRYA